MSSIYKNFKNKQDDSRLNFRRKEKYKFVWSLDNNITSVLVSFLHLSKYLPMKM